MRLDQFDKTAFETAVSAYKDWAETENVIYEQPNEALSTTNHDGIVTLRNVRGLIRQVVVWPDRTEVLNLVENESPAV